MRYYKISIVAPQGQKLPEFLTKYNNRYSVFESHPNGSYNPGCPEISFDVVNLNNQTKQFVFKIYNVPAELVAKAYLYKQLLVVKIGRAHV